MRALNQNRAVANDRTVILPTGQRRDCRKKAERFGPRRSGLCFQWRLVYPARSGHKVLSVWVGGFRAIVSRALPPHMGLHKFVKWGPAMVATPRNFELSPDAEDEAEAYRLNQKGWGVLILYAVGNRPTSAKLTEAEWNRCNDGRYRRPSGTDSGVRAGTKLIRPLMTVEFDGGKSLFGGSTESIRRRSHCHFDARSVVGMLYATWTAMMLSTCSKTLRNAQAETIPGCVGRWPTGFAVEQG